MILNVLGEMWTLKKIWAPDGIWTHGHEIKSHLGLGLFFSESTFLQEVHLISLLLLLLFHLYVMASILLLFSDSCLEGAWLWQDDRSRETNARVRSESTKRAKTSTYCPLLWSNYWSLQYYNLHCNGVLWRRWFGSVNSQT